MVRITVYTAERNVWKDGLVQKGLSSIFGVVMAKSNCPVMNFLKPMARFHLLFSTESPLFSGRAKDSHFFLDIRFFYDIKGIHMYTQIRKVINGK